MRTSMTIGAIAVILGTVLACNDPGKAQDKVDKAQTQANEDNAKAQADIDRKQAEANESLTKAKNSYRGTFTDLIADLDKHTADLKASRMTAKQSDLASIDAKLANIASLRTTITADLRSLDTATAAGWDAMKDQFDKDTTQCRSALLVGKT